MIELTGSDYRPLTSFELLERWTSPKKDTLPEQTLKQLKPLAHTKAAKLWNYTSRYRNELWDYASKDIPEPLPDTSSFTSIIYIDVNSEGIERTTEKLMSLGLSPDELIISMWDEGIGMLIPWGTFCDYWSNLCFPSSDDVSICPISESWFLQYHHEDLFVFGRIRPDLPVPVKKVTSVMPGVSFQLQDEILRLLQANEKITAIKLYQKETGVLFKEAIEAVEKLRRDILYSQAAQNQAKEVKKRSASPHSHIVQPDSTYL